MTEDAQWLYRQMIDAMAVTCLRGEGQVSAERVRVGVWNVNAHEIEDVDPTQQAMNDLIAGLSAEQRTTLAAVVAEEFSSGMFHALRVLHAARCAPFEDGYDGTPGDDFLGRLEGWEWPRG